MVRAARGGIFLPSIVILELDPYHLSWLIFWYVPRCQDSLPTRLERQYTCRQCVVSLDKHWGHEKTWEDMRGHEGTWGDMRGHERHVGTWEDWHTAWPQSVPVSLRCQGACVAGGVVRLEAETVLVVEAVEATQGLVRCLQLGNRHKVRAASNLARSDREIWQHFLYYFDITQRGT